MNGTDACSRLWRNNELIFTFRKGCAVPAVMLVIVGAVEAFISACLIGYVIKALFESRAALQEKFRASMAQQYEPVIGSAPATLRCCDLLRSVRFSFLAMNVLFGIIFLAYSMGVLLFPFAGSESDDTIAMHAFQSVILVVYYACALRLSQMTNVAAVYEGKDRTASQCRTVSLFVPCVAFAVAFYVAVAAGVPLNATQFLFFTHISLEAFFIWSVMFDLRELGIALIAKRESLGLEENTEIATTSTGDEIGDVLVKMAKTCVSIHTVRIIALVLVNVDEIIGNFTTLGALAAALAQFELLIETFYIVARFPKR